MNGIFIFLIVLVMGITLGLVIVERFSRGVWRTVLSVLMFIVLVVSLRMLFLDNDVVWPIYGKNLKLGVDITNRQNHSLENTVGSWRKVSERNSQYFSLGSSQSGHVFGQSQWIFSMCSSSLAFDEYSFFRKEILLKHPRAVILYISEFDMVRNYSIDGVKALPMEADYLISFLVRDIEVGQKGWVKRFCKACPIVYENFVPEVKQGFIMRSFLNKLIGVSAEDVEYEKKVIRRKTYYSQEEFLKSAIIDSENLYGRLNVNEKGWLALEEFISFFEKRDIRVVILEGQYLPTVMSSVLALKANKVFRDRLMPIVHRHQNVLFISREGQFLFSSEDYRDMDWKHVKKEAARRYCEHLLSVLSKHLDING
ncbi:MAG: hypothetical protein HQL15_03710 [Candidatus Omnitrophica bacterium]|nr:hypothetical protein [Candidatus Omnitrophota bacterium]MBF0489709.1 hypothetical protein [Candidatus Omnitrophota bacterium]